MTVGFEPTPFRTRTLIWRLRPTRPCHPGGNTFYSCVFILRFTCSSRDLFENGCYLIWVSNHLDGYQTSFWVIMEKSPKKPTKEDQVTFCNTMGRLLEMAPNNRQFSGWCICIYVYIEFWFWNFQRTNSDI